MLIIKQKRIYREDLQANPRILYIFGDNLEREGFGGQAKEMRGEPNAFGIATKRAITHGDDSDYFFDTDEDALGIIYKEFENLYFHVDKVDIEYSAICIPLDGIGTGLARLQENAPKLLLKIEYLLEELKHL